MKKISMRVLPGSLSCLALAAGFTVSSAQAGSLPLLLDDFARPDSPSLGVPWGEAEELVADTAVAGPGTVEILGGRLTYHYVTHALKATNPGLRNGRPLAYAPLSLPVLTYPVSVSFHFAPHEDERTLHDAGLMNAAAGFKQVFDAGLSFSVPRQALAVRIARTSSSFANSTVQLVEYLGSSAPTVLGSRGLPPALQLESTGVYTFTLTIQANRSLQLEVTDGITTASVATGPSAGTYALDQFFLTDVQGGVSGGPRVGGKHYFLTFDDVAVSSEVDAAGLCALIQGWTRQGLASSLCTKLRHVEEAAARDADQAREGVLGALAHEIAAQSGKGLSAEQAAQLLRLLDAI